MELFPYYYSLDNMCTGEVIWGVSAVLACAVFFFFWPLPPFHLLSPFYWHCHRHSMKATDWMRRWVRVRRVRYCLLSVCFFPPTRLLECKRGGGLQMPGHGPLSSPRWSWIKAPHMHCLSQHLPSLVWSFVLTALLHIVHMRCLVYVFSRIP